jgi:hypothetical protein
VRAKTYPTRAERIALTETIVTLNGQRARITGYNQEFATVRASESGASGQWAWQTAARIVAKGGLFLL